MILKTYHLKFIFYGLFGFCILLILSTALGAAAGSGNEVDGKMVANHFCSGCHSISKQGDSTFSKAPPFREIVKKMAS